MKINELYQYGGFFAYLYSKSLFSDFVSSTDEALNYDLGYFFSHSHDKDVLSVFDNLVKFYENDSTPEVTSLNKLYDLIIAKFLDNWKSVFEAYTASYNPLENYSMLEQENVASKITTTSKGDSASYGFNTTEENGSPTAHGESEVTSGGLADDNERILNRSGNIGVTTSQQMLQSEIDLRRFVLLDRMYNDIDSILSKSIYE